MMNMEGSRLPGRAAAAAHQNLKERDYWLEQLSGQVHKSCFPYDHGNYLDTSAAGDKNGTPVVFPFCLAEPVCEALTKLSRGVDHTLHMILSAGLVVLLHKYTGSSDILTGTTIYKQETGARIINTVLVLRNRLQPGMTFKELLLQVRETIVAAVENYRYPVEILAEQLNMPVGDEDFPLFDAAVILQNIQDKNYLNHIPVNMLFSFLNSGTAVEGTVEYNPRHYSQGTVQRLFTRFSYLLDQALSHSDVKIDDISILSPEEKRHLLTTFNDTESPYPEEKTIQHLFEEQVERTPRDTALVGTTGESLAYRELNERANRLAHLLRGKGIGPDTIVGIIMEPCVEMIIGILAILKSGGAYLPISPDAPVNRVLSMLEDSSAPLLLTLEKSIASFSFRALRGFDYFNSKPRLAPPRPQIKDIDSLQIPDRSLIDYEKYRPFIGQAMVKNSITIHMSRGCVYNCAFCFKIWPRNYIIRSAENIFNEIHFYYKLGIRRFAFVDDLPNIDVKVSSKVFQLIIDQGLKVHLHFPNGIRGDILTPEYIDLMVAAGAITMDLALETTSPRLQKLIRKNLDLKKLEENIKYITQKHPQVILELQIIHGLPTETEEEAEASIEFIKNIRYVHFPYIHILNIYPNSDMARIAVKNGVSKEAIERSADLAYHELPETLPFSKGFTRKYQSEFLNDYFLSKERLKAVLPYQMKVLTEDELLQKYNSYLPMEIQSFAGLLDLSGLSRAEIAGDFLPADYGFVPGFNRKLQENSPRKKPGKDALKVLLLDLTQYFTRDTRIMYDVVEPPLGLLYLATHLQRSFGSQIDAKIAKSRIDFDSFDELQALIAGFAPHVIGVRTLNFYREFFHKTISLIKQWQPHIPIIAGGPYATSNYDTVLKDSAVDLVVIGEGEATLSELIGEILRNGYRLPDQSKLARIPGVAFAERRAGREVLLLDRLGPAISREAAENPPPVNNPSDLAYIIYTSGSTGIPKGVLIRNSNLVNQVTGLQKRFNFDASLNYMLLAAFTFDVSVMHIFSPLITGSRLFLIDEETRKDPNKLWQFVYQKKIDILNIVPAYMKILLDHIEKGKIHLKYLFVGGDIFDTELLRGLRETFEVEHIINIYGPTETTINATLYPCGDTERGTELSIGKPLKNYRAFILDKELQPLPIGAAGELCIAGDGVARGYLNQPELTAEKFIDIASQFTDSRIGVRQRQQSGGPGLFSTYNFQLSNFQLIYKTGDLSRWLPDGNIEFLGRLDNQVKVRGFRIELGEIESRLLKHPDIVDGVVTVKEDSNGEKYLCAYFTEAQNTSPEREAADLRKFLSQALPDFMIPAYFVRIEKIPLSTTGKPDLKALPEPQALSPGAAYVAPRNILEEKLVDLWTEVVAMEKETIGIDSNFFELGGHSLKATILVSRIHKQMDVNIPLVQLFKTPTIRGLSQYLAEVEETPFVSIEKAVDKPAYSLSSAQKRLYILQQVDKENTGYNLPSILFLQGNLDRKRIEDTFNRLVERHESFRTSFHMEEEEPVQRIHDPADIELNIEYFAAGNRQEEAGIVDRFIRPFDLSRAPLLRVAFIEIEKQKYIFMFDMHHIISDAASMGILTVEFMAYYGGKTLPPLPLQYKDYAEWQNSEAQRKTLIKQEEYWLGQFGGGVPVLELPTDFSRPAIQSYAGRMLSFEIGPEETAGLKKMALHQGATLYMVLLAIYNILMSKLSGQEDIIVGTPTAGRRHASLEGIIGMFVNTLGVRNFPGGETTFTAFLEDVKNRTLHAFDNQEYQFEDLVEKINIKRDAARNPLFDVMFTLHNVEIDEVEIPGLKLSPYEHENRTAKFDLTLLAAEADEKIIFVMEYCTKLFNEATIRRYINYFKTIVTSVLQEPQKKLAHIEIFPEAEKKQVLFDFNDTGAEYPADKTLHGLFSEQALRMPGSTAVLFEGNTLTYRELDEKTDILAALLVEQGVKMQDLVGLLTERSVEMIIGILGILKAGCGYVPLNPTAPVERTKYMLTECAVRRLLTTRSLSKEVEELKVEKLRAAAPGVENLYFETIFIDDIPTPQRGGMGSDPDTGVGAGLAPARDSSVFDGQPQGLPLQNLHRTPAPANSFAYVIFTSGSTGEPKGVPITHANLSPLLHWGYRELGIGSDDRTIQNVSYYFDWSVWEIFITLTTGAGLYIAPDDVLLSPDTWFDFVKASNITIMHVIPSQYQYLVSQGKKTETLKYLFIGGEKLTCELVERGLTLLNKDCRVFNMYGITESAIISTTLEIKPEEYENFRIYSGIPIGKPVGNTGLLILNKYLKPCPINVTGELYIAGDGLASGYLNNPELTAEKFVDFDGQPQGLPLQLSTHKLTNSQLIYRTGDLARWLPQGNVEFLGRIDYQVKIRGFRIEPGEIEEQLFKHEQIKEAVVIDRENEAGEKYLCAYFVVKDAETSPGSPDSASLREYLALSLPDYMIPAFFMPLEKIPLTPNGKLDRKSLPAPGSVDLKTGEDYVPPRTTMEKAIAHVWQEVLGLKEVGIHDRYFDIGGNSLNIIRIGRKLNLDLGIDVPVVLLFRFPTIGVLANYLDQEVTAKDARKKRVDRTEKVDRAKSRRLQKLEKRRSVI